MEILRCDESNAAAMMKLASTGALDMPIIFPRGGIHSCSSWKSAEWNAEFIKENFGAIETIIRLFPRGTPRVVAWEHHSKYILDTIANFILWMTGQIDKLSSTSPLKTFDLAVWWGYCDYKHFDQLFQDEVILDRAKAAIDWSSLGLSAGLPSTLWLGCLGAYTPCHQDTYGFNFVAQILGKKRWILFDPKSSATAMYPVRLPYEESSIFSAVNIKAPDYSKHPAFKTAIPFTCILSPGDVLYVPTKFWHFVETVDEPFSLSVNTWVGSKVSDARERVKEGIVRLLVTAVKEFQGLPHKFWLNPTEDVTEYNESVTMLRESVKAYKALAGLAEVEADGAFDDLLCNAIVSDQAVELIACMLIGSEFHS